MWAKIARVLGLLPEPPRAHNRREFERTLDSASRTYEKTWAVVNENRVKRGERPLPPPSWDTLLEVNSQRK